MSVATENDRESGKRNGLEKVLNPVYQVDNTAPILVDASAWDGQFFSSNSLADGVIRGCPEFCVNGIR